ncbi:MAG: exo-alpha-sialidase [Rhodospirillales bacterium]|nr:exo-alpha-sialidase [Rhodospirillales bacterium]
MTDNPTHPRFSAVSLPTNRVQNHASNLIALPNGDILCVWFAGTMEGKSDISVHMTRRRKGSSKWGAPLQLSNDSERSEQNPVLFLDPDGRLWLFYTAQPGGNQQQAFVRCRTSSDLGESWSEPRQMFDELGLFVRQPVVVLDNNRWLLPVFYCNSRGGETWTGEHDHSAVKISHDRGMTWDEVAVPGSTGCVHMNILKRPDGQLVAFYRSRWADHIYRSISNDAGRTWSPPSPTDLPNNNSSIQATTLKNGHIAMVFNRASAMDATGRRTSLYDDLDEQSCAKEPPQSRAFWGAPRSPLSLALSLDGGKSWPKIVTIAEGDGYCLSNDSASGVNRELSYPSIIQSEDGLLHISYTHHRKTIKYLCIDESDAFS